MEHKFKVCSGISIIILAIVLGIVNIGTPIALIVRYVVIWEGVGKLIGMCFVALLTISATSLISTIYVLLPEDKSSDAPTRVNILSATPP